MSGSPPRKILTSVGFLGLGLALMVLVFLVLFRTALPSVISKQNPGRFDRPLFEAIVAQVRQADLKPDIEQQFFLDDLSNAKSLRPLSDGEAMKLLSGKGAGHVWARVSPHGALKVVIETRDMGHAGEYGFAYSDTALAPAPMEGDGNWFRVDVPGHLYIVVPKMKIDEHWWEVLNNLN